MEEDCFNTEETADRLARGCMYDVTTGRHTSCYNVHQAYTQTTTGCNTDCYNSRVVYMLHAIGVKTGRNTSVNTNQPVYMHLNSFTCLQQSHDIYHI